MERFVYFSFFIIFVGVFNSACQLDARIVDLRTYEFASNNKTPEQEDLPQEEPIPITSEFKYFTSFSGTTPKQLNLYSYDVETKNIAKVAMGQFTTTSFSSFEFTKNGTRLVTSNNNGLVKLFSIERNSEVLNINELSSATATGSPSGWGMCVAPDGSSVHYVRFGSNKIDSFKVTNDTLSYVGSVPAPTYVVNCVVSRDSKYLITAGYTSAKTQSFAINQNSGALTSINSVGGVNGPAWVATSRDSDFVFTVAQNGSQLVAYELNQETGVIVEVDRISTLNSNPDFLDVREINNEVFIYINSSTGSTSMAKFDRVSKKVSDNINNINGNPNKQWFYAGKDLPFLFMNGGSGVTKLFEINTDGATQATEFHTYTSDRSLREIHFNNN
jgi:6-phosphogluconolactonase (cycloisomerase 2 family)